MEIKETTIPGVKIIFGNIFRDDRGQFLKVFNLEFFEENLLDTHIKEVYFSTSNKNVIRGMHFQIPPKDHKKIVYVSKGSIIDVLLDIRSNSPTYKKYITINLSSQRGEFLYIPQGIAHGFLSLENNTIVNYMQTSCYSEKHDSGILYNSFGYNWEGLNFPIVSKRDSSFIGLENFSSPFNL